MKAEDLAESAIRAVNRGRPEAVRSIFAESVNQHGHKWTCDVFVERFALEAARAMDVGLYTIVHQLFDLLLESTPPYLDRRYIMKQFSDQGGGLELVPTGQPARGLSQLATARG